MDTASIERLTPDPLDPALCPVAQDYLRMDSAGFYNTYSGEERFRLGIGYNYQEDCNVYTRAARPVEEVRGRDVLRGNRPRRAQGGGAPSPEPPAMWNDSGFYADGAGKIRFYRDEAPSPLTR